VKRTLICALVLVSAFRVAHGQWSGPALYCSAPSGAPAGQPPPRLRRPAVALAKAGAERGDGVSASDGVRGSGGQRPPDYEETKQRARRLIQAGQYADARAELERLIAAHPDDAEGRYLLGLVAFQLQDPGTAATHLRRVLAGRPHDRLALKLLARALAVHGDTTEAVSYLERAVAAEPRDGEAWSLLGRLHQEGQRFAAAARALERALRLDPADVPALTALANAYVGLGRIDSADETFRRAVEVNARAARPQPDAYASYAIFLLRVNRLDEAEAEAGRAAALDRDSPLLQEAQRALARRTRAPSAKPGVVLPAPRFVDIAKSAGINVLLQHSPTAAKHQIETMAGGVAVLDYDRDGLVDLYFTNGAESPSLRRSGPAQWNRLYRNRDGGRFEDVTERAGVRGDGYMMGAASADFDNDGFPDLFVAGVGRSILYRNNGDGTFRDVTAAARITSTHPVHGSLWSIHGAWLDFDRDGWLDLFVVNYCHWNPATEPFCGGRGPGERTYCHPDRYAPLPNQLFRNNGDGTFREVSTESRIAGHLGKGMGAAVGDIDGDGWPDVFVANDTEPNFLFRNRGDGAFEEVAAMWGVAANQFGAAVSAMGADLRDVDNDGRVDLFVTDLSNEGFLLFRNTGARYDDASDFARITFATLPYTGWSNPVADYNNDGWKDLFSANGHVIDNIERVQGRTYRQPNTLLLNNGDGTFRDVSTEVGPDLARPAAHRGAAVADVDNDGRLDLIVTALGDRPKLLRNVSVSDGGWISLRLVGRTSNRDGLGTIVRVTLDDGRVLVNHATTSVGFASSSDPRVHVGLGLAAHVAQIELWWPSGVRQTIERPQLNTVLTVEEAGRAPRAVR
jgi:enediyne biosynthesis protein E4